MALGLGIGANTAIFSTVHALLLLDLPYSEPERLVMVWEDATFAGFPRNTPAPANYFDWKAQVKPLLRKKIGLIRIWCSSAMASGNAVTRAIRAF